MCNNPFFKCRGESNKIAVVIRLKGKDYEICSECWEKIGDSGIQWGEPLPKLKEIKSPLGTPSLSEVRQNFYGKR